MKKQAQLIFALLKLRRDKNLRGFNMGLRCKIGFHKFKSTGIIEKIAVFDIYRPYSMMEKHVCECCGKEEWREIDE